MAQRGGFAILPQRMLHDKSIPQGAKMTYLALSSFVGDRDEVWPSHSTLADLTGSSISSVQRSLKWLREAGWVAWRPGANEETNAQTSNRYVVHTEPHPPVTVTDPPGQGDRRTRTTEQEPTTTPVVEVVSEVKNELQYAHTWTPGQVAVDAVFNSARLNNFIYLPDEHLDHYLSRMSELKRQPSNTEWVRWFGQDQSKRIAEERSHIRNEVSDYADDGTPNSWKL